MENTIKIYDSAYCDLPHEEELTVASLVAVTSDRLQVIFPNVLLCKQMGLTVAYVQLQMPTH